ncbi:MAG: hypothetical protein HY445_02400 [Candidatus Niyogibacteria bacterium]|nr:hypothetical protein [Candidatus Niyogibacteria bacterium]
MVTKKDAAYHILRVGLGITFVWIGILIFQNPESWGGFLQPWAAGLLPVPIKQAMIGTAILDILLGFLFLIDVLAWAAGLVGAIHLAIILTTSGIDGVTVRDIGLLGAALAVALIAWKEK